MKKIQSTQTIYDLVKNDPEIGEIMKSLGFEHITDPIMLNTAGRVMTIRKGAEMKHIDMETIRKKFSEHNYELED